MQQKKQRGRLSILLGLSIMVLFGFRSQPIRVACVGDSITFGSGIAQREKYSYPAQMQELLGKKYDVQNFGVGGRTMLKKGDFPYWNEKVFQDAMAFLPQIVIIKLGTNDSKPQNWKYEAEYKKDYLEMIRLFKALPSKPRILLVEPVPVFETMWGIRDSVVFNHVIPIVKQIGLEAKLETIDLYTPLKEHPEFFPDKVHPNALGASVMAIVIAEAIEHKNKKN